MRAPDTVAQLVLELFSEEIPARMQTGAARDLARLAREGLGLAHLTFDEVQTYAGARRLTLVVNGLPARQPDRLEERKGPRINAPVGAVEGFLRATGLTRPELTERDGVLWAVTSKAGRPTATLAAELVEEIVRRFPWPKSMVWGEGKLRWIRPLHRVLCVFDGEIVDLSIEHLRSGDMSEGHRVMGPSRTFHARSFAQYAAGLAKHFVVLDVEARKARILAGAESLCASKGVRLVMDAGLLDEVAGMVEWPTPIMGDMDAAFLDLPSEVIRTTMRNHQRYFAVARADGNLAPHFITVANLDTADGGALIAEGNARVLSARLSDARFFWDQDRKATLESRLGALDGVVFHARLGTMRARAARIEAVARCIAPIAGAAPEEAALAARLCKTDLTTGMVREFPELQGVMGRYYAIIEGLDPGIADAIRDHYRPQGPSDATPTAPVSIAVALADKLDTLMGFFGIGETPTGSRDPYALRRAALGVIRIILENGLRTSIGALAEIASGPESRGDADAVVRFVLERWKVMLRDQGVPHDVIEAVFALGDDDLVRTTDRLEAITTFLRGADGADLVASYKRASNILAAEEKKGPLSGSAAIRVAEPAAEGELFDALAAAEPGLDEALRAEDFHAAMTALASLREPIDRFFETVLVNSDDPVERSNRLALLAGVRNAMGKVADFSAILG
jgi:glycyl-tRNA synthetase beta chain